MITVVHLDAVSVPLVERLLAGRRLPALAALRERGTLLPLESTGFYFGDRATAHTGVEVAEHGETFPLQWSAAEQRLRFHTAFPTAELLWDRLARSGRRSLVLDPYEGRAPTTDVGLAVSGWQVRHPAVLRRWTEPGTAARALRRRFGRAPMVEEVYGRPSVRALESLRRQLLAAPRRAAALAAYELSQRPYDHAWIELCSGHFAGHHFWDLSPLQAQLGAERRHELEGTVADSYEAMDAALSEVVAALPADADVLVFSEVGMGENHSRTDLLPEMLSRVVGTRRADEPATGAGQLLWRLRAAVPADARLAVARALPDGVTLDLSARLFQRGVDWSRTRAFVLPSDHDGFVRLNVRGRERDGIVDPGESDALLAEIAEGLSSFADPDGAPCVERCEIVSDLAGAGTRAERLPDLVVHWAERPPADGVTSPRFGDVRRRGLGIGRSGNHVAGAWLLVLPGGSSRLAPSTRPPRLVDLAATVVGTLGADGAGLRGRPLLEPC